MADGGKIWATGDPTIDAMLERCVQILTTKGHDYTSGSRNDDRLKNFREIAEKFGVKPELVIGIYMYKHWTAIDLYIKEGKVESEPIGSRIADMINYLLLLWCMVAPKEEARSVAELVAQTTGSLPTFLTDHFWVHEKSW